jgi:hypothetical protein
MENAIIALFGLTAAGWISLSSHVDCLTLFCQ